MIDSRDIMSIRTDFDDTTSKLIPCKDDGTLLCKHPLFLDDGS